MIEESNESKIEIIDTIKLLIYKENIELLKNLDSDENIYLEPILFSYFNGKKEYLFSSEVLEEALQGYFKENPN